MKISLPPLFEEKLAGNDREQGIIFSSLHTFGKWFETSKTIFFLDYTDHGPKHITNILATAAALVTKDAIPVITASDVTVLTLATLLHDAALHLAEPGFKHIIAGDASDRLLTDFDRISWSRLWDDFLFSARRWDDHKLADVLGVDFVNTGNTITNPLAHWDNLTLTDCRLIGEFIRCHHARLSHEFAVYGVPGITPDFITLPTELPNDWRDLAGIIARSHGLSLRSCMDCIRMRYHLRDYQGIHAIYLMALLRLSDYLQIEASRAPDIVFRYRVLPSRISSLEWRAHNAVKNITPEHEDPESVEIDTDPPDVKTYLRLREWLNGIQSELDLSWAVLGEVYGRYPKLRDLGLLWRRVRSNLDNRSDFASTVQYLPRRIRMEVARSELLSLLIRPLYGNDPSYGIRELMQNAVDAVREREYFQQHNPEFADIKLREQEADVVVWLSDFSEKDACAWLEVSDCGIGMNEEVLTGYFLTAGASYRHSEQWQHSFERSDLPPDQTKPRAQILRSGRFGVGALASFLIGDSIEVETRHITSADGFRFSVELAQDAIEIKRVDGLPIGTRIRIRVEEETFRQLGKKHATVFKPALWDWYQLDTPIVLRILGEKREPLENSAKILLKEWRKAESDIPCTIYWTFDNQWPALSCNGIFVSNSERLPKLTVRNNSQFDILRTPKLHISDADGYLPLSLTRKEITSDEYGFEDDLSVSIVKDYLARILVQFPEKLEHKAIRNILAKSPVMTIGHNNQYVTKLPDCIIANQGFCLPFNNMLQTGKADLKHILWLDLENHNMHPKTNLLQLVPNLTSWDCIVLSNGASFSLPLLEDMGYDYHGGIRYHKHRVINMSEWQITPEFPILHYRYTTMDTFFDKLTTQTKKKHNTITKSKQYITVSTTEKTYWKERIDGENCFRTRLRVESLGLPESKYPFSSLQLESDLSQRENPFVAEFVLKENWNGLINGGLLGHWWSIIFGDMWIPWSKNDRKIRFPKAYKELEPYLSYYE